MSSERVTVSLPEDVRRAAQRIAADRGVSFSTVVSEALTGWMRARLVDAWLAEHQAAHGRIRRGRAALARRRGGRPVPGAGPKRAPRSMNLVLDAGALIGIDRDDRRVAGLIELGRRAGATLVTVAPAVAQAWRGGPRQARLARLLAMIDVRATALRDARAAGDLLAASGTADVVDALLAIAALPGDRILTSDPADMGTLSGHRNIHVTVVRV